VFTCVSVYLLVEGGEVFDAKQRFGADCDLLKRCDLRGRKSYRRGEGVKIYDLTIAVREFPVSSKVNITGVGDEVEFS